MHSFRPTFLEIDTLNSKLIKEKNCTQKPLELQKPEIVSKGKLIWNQIKSKFVTSKSINMNYNSS